MSGYYALAVTGGIGCGKSSVLEILKNASFEILDTDKIVHQILCENLDLKNKIIDEFGEQCLSIKGDINREVLGKKIFKSEEKRNVLNSLIHPIVRKKTLDWMTYCENKDFVTAVEIPLLFECGWEKLNWNCIMSIEADTNIVKSRLLQRGLSKNDIELSLHRNDSPLNKSFLYLFSVNEGAVSVFSCFIISLFFEYCGVNSELNCVPPE